MEVIATPTKPREEIQESKITMIDDSSGDEGHSFDLTLVQQTVPVAVKAHTPDDGTALPSPATGPVEVPNVFDSLSDSEHSSEGAEPMAQSTDSLDLMFG